ncbi:MAG: biopolymer transporter Tol [Ignavibacteriae bacterium]|nr:biopolymer transporter Tol [Ignavibacteriota bacterium]
MRNPLVITALVAVALCSVARSQEEFPHPELEWRTIETEHFLVHFHAGAERTAQEVAQVAERIYEPITSFYLHKPDQRVSIVIRDHDDYSNGAAYFYDNKIEIFAPSLDFELRGTHPWIENVVTHEFTHIVQIQTAMKLGRTVPAVYFQWLGYESERRPDVLSGYPNVIVSYPLSALVVPAWFAEGAAQYNHPDLHHDRWDTHREMILRTALLDNKALSWEEMAVFGKTSLGNEQSYNAGYSFVGYIAQTYGADKLREISQALGSFHRTTISGAIESVLQKTGEELYEEWKQSQLAVYQKTLHNIGALVEGEVIEERGFGNFYPTFMPGGKNIAYVATGGRDYFSLSTVYMYDRETKKKERVVSGVRSALSFSPDGRYLYYSKATSENPYWSKQFDIYRYDLQQEDEQRFTHGWRAMNPQLSRDGSKLVFVVSHDGTTNVAVADADGKNYRKITAFENGEQVYTPSWSYDGEEIAFGFSTGHNQSVAIIHADGSGFREFQVRGNSRNPVFSINDSSLYYSSDVTGIFNIYEMSLETGATRQMTNVIGGAFLPAVNEVGDLVYALYTSTGYKIALLPRDQQSAISTGAIAALTPRVHGTNSHPTENPPAEPLPDLPTRAYRNVFTSLTLVPVVRIDNYNQRNTGLDVVKAGLYFSSYDMVGKLTLFGGAMLNRKFERDLFFIFEYRDKVPGLYQLGLDPVLSAEVYNITRKTTSGLELPPYLVDVDVTYNLLEFDLFLKQNIYSEHNTAQLGYTFSRYSADIGSFINPNDSQLYSSFRSLYLIANTFSLQLRHSGIEPSGESEINPVGRSFSLRYTYELNRFNPDGDFEIRNGFVEPIYKHFNFHRVELDWNEHIPLPLERHVLTLSLRGGSILGGPTDNFFDFYAGGFIGMRGYPFYSLGGNEYATLHAEYRFPIWRTINFRFLQFYFTKLYGSVFGDIGEAWTGSTPAFSEWKTDAGFELRLESFSFYAFPTRIFFSGAYGFDRFTRTVNNIDITYGREWRFYVGVLFSFDISQTTRRLR